MKFRWSKVYESSEEELLDFLDSRKLKAERWAAGEFHAFGTQQFDTPMTIWCAEGSLSLRIKGDNVSLQPGDAVQLPANVEYEMDAGISGCVCYETAQPTAII